MADVEYLHDPGIVDECEQLGLALEALNPGTVLGPPGLDHLHGYRARQASVQSSVDTAERTFADQGVQLVATVEGATGEIRRPRHTTSIPSGACDAQPTAPDDRRRPRDRGLTPSPGRSRPATSWMAEEARMVCGPSRGERSRPSSYMQRARMPAQRRAGASDLRCSGARSERAHSAPPGGL